MSTQVHEDSVHSRSLFFIDGQSLSDKYTWDPWTKKSLIVVDALRTPSNRNADPSDNSPTLTEQSILEQHGLHANNHKSYCSVVPQEYAFLAHLLIAIASVICIAAGIVSILQSYNNDNNTVVPVVIHVLLVVGTVMLATAFLVLGYLSVKARPVTRNLTPLRYDNGQSFEGGGIGEGSEGEEESGSRPRSQTLPEPPLGSTPTGSSQAAAVANFDERERVQREFGEIQIGNQVIRVDSPDNHQMFAAIQEASELQAQLSDPNSSNQQTIDSSSPHTQESYNQEIQPEQYDDNNDDDDNGNDDNRDTDQDQQHETYYSFNISSAQEGQIYDRVSSATKSKWIFDLVASVLLILGSIGICVTVIFAFISDVEQLYDVRQVPITSRTYYPCLLVPILTGCSFLLAGNLLFVLADFLSSAQSRRIPIFCGAWWTLMFQLLGSLGLLLGILLAVGIEEKFQAIDYLSVVYGMVAGFSFLCVGAVLGLFRLTLGKRVERVAY